MALRRPDRRHRHRPLGAAAHVLGLTKLWCEVLLSNEAVWRLHEAHGFKREALFREHVVKNGAPVDVVGLGLLARDWAEKREAMAAKLRAKGYEIPA